MSPSGGCQQSGVWVCVLAAKGPQVGATSELMIRVLPRCRDSAVGPEKRRSRLQSAGTMTSSLVSPPARPISSDGIRRRQRPRSLSLCAAALRLPTTPVPVLRLCASAPCAAALPVLVPLPCLALSPPSRVASRRRRQSIPIVLTLRPGPRCPVLFAFLPLPRFLLSRVFPCCFRKAGE